ncbi:MAG TPA: sulfatase-like hydrolase/transferase, partial [Chitinophagaceae bacterium]|nr:sulfatase-like hydrolase/transferase [Chitinophagaceae bacterium]
MAQKVSQNTPNIIYIYADDLGYGELGSYGQQKIKTPQLDRLAKEGVRFTQHYAGAPVCAPSRAMLMTGKHAGHSYIRGNYELGGFRD